MNENSEADNKIVDGAPPPPEAPGYRRPRVKRPPPATTRFKRYFSFLSMTLGFLAFYLQYDRSPDAFHGEFEFLWGALLSIFAGLVAGVVISSLLVGIFRENKRKARIVFGVWVVLVIALLVWCARPVDPIQRDIRWLDYPGSLLSITLSSEYGPRYWKHYANLVQLGDAAVPALTRVLKTSQNPNAREEATRILGKIREKEATQFPVVNPSKPAKSVRSLVVDAFDHDLGVAHAALESLAQRGIDKQQVCDRMIPLLRDLPVGDRLRAAEFLIENGRPEATIQPIANALKDLKAHSSWAEGDQMGDALELLQRIGPSARKCTPLLVDLLYSEDFRDMNHAERALATIAPDIFKDKALPRILNMLNSSDPLVRQDAIRRLSECNIWSPEIAAALEWERDDSDSGVREAARKALSKLETQGSGRPEPLAGPPAPKQEDN